MNSSDEEIVEQVLAGEKELYAALVERYQRPVYNLMYRYSRSREEAADLTQDVFLQAFDKLGTFARDRRFFPWLYKLALNKAGDWARKYKSRITHQNVLRHSEQHYEDAGQHGEIELREQLQQVSEALLKLPAHMREILILRYRHDQSIRQVAEIFDLSESAVKMRIKRGLEQLRMIMEEEDREHV